MRLAPEYIAGFLDCDGCISVVHSRQPKLKRDEIYPKINFYSQNLEVLNDIQEIVGGKITPRCNALAVYVLQLGPKATVSTIKMLLPYLRIKKEQALTILELDKLNKSYTRIGKRYGLGGQEPVPQSIYDQRMAICIRVRELNHRDSQAFRKNRVNSVELSTGETMPSQAAEGKGSAEGVTIRSVSPNNNPIQERPARKGRDDLSSAISRNIQ